MDVVDDRTCGRCGKVFRTPAEYQRHENRKTPCIVQEVAPEDVDNPNRCIYCNHVFVQLQSLTRHQQTCKVKNGKINLPNKDDELRMDMRIIKDQQRLDAARIDVLEAEIKSLRDQNKRFAQRLDDFVPRHYKSAHERLTARVLMNLFPDHRFETVRPPWIRNPDTGRPLELDFYCEELALAIECQGKQHYEETPHFHRDEFDFPQQLVRDEFKVSACEQHGIKLICIPYTVTSVAAIEREICRADW